MKIAHAMTSGTNHRTDPQAKDRSYKCTIRRDYAEAIATLLGQAVVAEADYERRIEVLRRRIEELHEALNWRKHDV